MSIREDYDNWSKSYDEGKNHTRDLDRLATYTTLADKTFGSTLEIGCGTGKNTPLLSKISDNVHAIDLSPAMVERAKEKKCLENVTFTVADITQRWPCERDAIDLISCNLLLEHIKDLGALFSEADRVLASSGTLFVSELHPCHQYLGKSAHFYRSGERIEIQAFTHSISEFIQTAQMHNFTLKRLEEWSHPDEPREPPRILTLLFSHLPLV